MKTTIYLIRHGQTEWNVARRMQGRLDSPLTALGREATLQLTCDFPHVDAIYSSPSGRTVQTARILFGDRNLVCDDRLMEIDMGTWEGRSQADLDLEDPVRHSSFWNTPQDYVPVGGECYQQVIDRAVACLNELVSRHAGETIAVVSHTTIIRSMLFSIEKRDLSDFWTPPAIYPASLSEIEIVDGHTKIIRFGCTAHYAHAHEGAY